MTQTSLGAIINALNVAGVRFLVIGGLALAAHGYVRCTVDLELLLDFEAANLARAACVFGGLGFRSNAGVSLEDFVDEAKRAEFVRAGIKVFRMRSAAHDRTGVDLLMYDPIGFAKAYGRRTDCELEGVTVPVCGYDDLVTLKRLANRSIDQTDLLQLEKARTAPTDAELHDPWFTATFEGCELDQLHKSAALPFVVKIAQLEEQHDLARAFQEARRKMSGPRTVRASGLVEDV